MPDARPQRLAIPALLALLAVLTVSPMVAQGQDDQQQVITDLRARVEAMERQNRELLKRLDRKEALFGDSDAAVGEVIPAGAGGEANAIYGEDEHIRSVVRDYLTAHEAEKKSAEPEWYEVGSDVSMSANWKSGLELESKNKDFKVHVGGRVQFDSGWFNAADSVQNSLPAAARFRDGVDFRRARLAIYGTMYEQTEWWAEFDFVNSAGAPVTTVTAPTDLWWQFKEVPMFGNIRVGNVKEPIGFDHLTSSRFLNFMERSFDQDAFYGGFNNGFTPGVVAFDSFLEDRMTWAAGIFKNTANPFGANAGGGEYSATVRLTGLPWYVDEGRGLLHLGVSARTADPDEGTTRFRTRADARSGLSQNWPIIADTGIIRTDNSQTVNAELVAVLGPLSVTAEFLTNWTQDAGRVGGPNVGTLVYRGGYVEALYFLTGEHRAYNRKTGVFDRVVPDGNAFLVKDEDSNWLFGRGAWQLAARYHFLDLNSKGINGGILHDTTLGVNWFLNPNMKIQLNYFYLHREAAVSSGNGVVQGVGLRIAHDF